MTEKNVPEEFDPRAALALADETQARAEMALYPHTPLLYLLWGTVWLVGYGALHGNRYEWLPLTLGQALAIFFAALSVGVVVSAILGIRASLGIRGPSALQGAVYGWTWGLSFGVVGLLSGVIATAISAEQLRGFIINAIAILVVGIMYMVGGALFRDLSMSVMGAWFLVVDIVALLVGPAYFLIIFLILGVLGFYAGSAAELYRRRRRTAARVQP